MEGAIIWRIMAIIEPRSYYNAGNPRKNERVPGKIPVRKNGADRSRVTAAWLPEFFRAT